ncbi:hypothetical protein AP75_06530 [Kaistella haifensis DSM 19056]|uniref:Uncharacterized protein n=1 Tax=Kaistella haifensis DSM 19056 TaxID=1450526 RepID=A0A2D0A6F9_9FLAO|nr:hypothetical protein AP75_06530 [Kaistella haifensis DSM 19056]
MKEKDSNLFVFDIDNPKKKRTEATKISCRWNASFKRMQLLFHRYGTTVPIFSPKSTVQWNRGVVKEKMFFLCGSGFFLLFIGLMKYLDKKMPRR